MGEQSARRGRRGLHAAVIAGLGGVALVGGRSRARAATSESWAGTNSGNWTTPSLWSPSADYPNNGTPPGATYDAIIAAVGSAYTVTLNSSVTVNSLTLNSANATIDQTGGVLSATNGISLQAGVFRLGGAIVGGTVTATGGTLMATGGTLDGVTLNGEVDVGQQQPASLYVNHDSALNGTVLVGNGSSAINGSVYFGATAAVNQTISGTANVLLGISSSNTVFNYNQGTLTLGSGVTIHGQSGSIVNNYAVGQIINQGKISADVATGQLVIGSSNGNGTGTFSNTGTLEAKNGATLILGMPWSNSGIITVNNSTLNLASTFTTAGIGTINRTGGTINITGTLDNSAASLNLNAASGSWVLADGGGIVGGMVNTSGGSTLIASGGTLDGVTLNGEVDVGQQQPASLHINHDSAVNGTVLVGNASSAINGNVDFGASAVGNQTFAGTANVLLGISTLNTVFNYNQGTLTLGSGVTIHGQNGSIVNIYGAGLIINQGKISAGVATGQLVIGSSNGNGTGTFSNTGMLEAKNGATLTLGMAWSNSGTITVNNGTLNLGNTFTTAGIGTINRTGGTINIIGTLDNSATGPLNLNASTGSWVLADGGGIVGGTISTSGGSTLIASGGTLDGVTFNGEVDVGQQQQASLYINHDSALNGTLLVGNPGNGSNGNVFFGATAVANQTFSGTANVLLGGSSNNLIYNYNQGVLTLGSGVIIHGQNGSIVNLFGNGQIINQGKISADVATGQLVIGSSNGNGAGTFSNSGTLETKNGATLTLGAAWSNSGTITVNNSMLNLGGTFTTAGIGTINRTGGTINLAGTLTNTSATLNLNAASGSWLLSGGIVGGTVVTSGGGVLIANGGTLDSVTLNGEVDVGLQQPASLFINHDSAQNGNLMVGGPGNGSNASVYWGASAAVNQTFSGTVSVLFGGASSNTLYNYNQGTLTLGPNVTIHGERGGIADIFGSGLVINQGTISADVAGGQISLGNGNGSFSNTGTLEAKNGGTLSVYTPTLTNLSGTTLTGGAYRVLANSTMDFGGATIATNAADVTLNGSGSTFAAINGFTTNNGTFTVTGARSFSMAVGFNNGVSGTINASGGGIISFTTGQNNGTIDSQPGGTINFNGNFSHNAGSTLRGSGAVNFLGGVQEFDGTLIGDIDLNLNGATPNFGSSFNGIVNSMSVTSGVVTYAAGAHLTIGAGGLNFSGAASPSVVMTSGTSPATLILNGDVNVSSNTTGLKQMLSNGSGAVDGTLDLGGVQRTFTVAQGLATPDLLIGARIINGSVRKSGTGTLLFSDANTYAGGTTLAAGELEASDVAGLGTGPVTFSGGMLGLQSDLATANYANTLSVAPANTMAIDIGRISPGAANTFHFGATTFGTALNVTGAGTLQFAGATLAHDLVVSDFANVDFNGPVSGGFAMTANSAGTTSLSGSTANTFSGLARVNAGVLQLNKTAGVNAIAGDVSAFTGGTVRWMASDQVADTSTVAINGSASTADLNGQNDTIGALSMTGGTVSLGAGKLTVAGAITINTNTPAANITGGGTITAASMNVLDNVKRSGGGVTRLGAAPTITAGKSLDLADTKLAVTGGTLGAWNGTNYSGITGLVCAGRNGGGWNGSGIVTSQSAASAASGLTTLAVAMAGDIGKTSLGGVSVSPGDVLVMYTYAGDADLDGGIDGDDYFRIDSGFSAHATGYHNGDFDLNGRVDADDYFIIDRNYVRQARRSARVSR